MSGLQEEVVTGTAVQTENARSGSKVIKRPRDDVNIEDMDDLDGEEDQADEKNNFGEVMHCPYENCTKEFSSRWSMTRHIRTHTGERPFQCAVCGKEFVQKCSLKRHEQTHSQEKQWICDIPQCGKRFKLKEYLDVHKRTHVKTDAPHEEDNPLLIESNGVVEASTALM